MIKNNLVYAYVHVDGAVLYIGVCSNNGKRHRQHLERNKFYQQNINQYLQNNDDWEYHVLVDDIESKEEALEIEKTLIKKYKPMFNIQHKGGD